MSGGPNQVAATFWLLDASDSLSAQSHRDPDGTGLGWFDEDGHPHVSKQPLAAYEDRQFGREAREVRSRTFVAHVRYASTGAVAPQNTHPFEQDGRLFAHNGVIGDLPALESELGHEGMALVRGDTDSERFFALVTERIDAGGGVGEAITGAARWVAERLPVYALNVILITATDLWALRYPDTHELHVLERAAGCGELHHRGRAGEVRVHSAELADCPAVVVASEPMDDDSGWRALEPGELLHVDPSLQVTIKRVLEQAPAHPLTLADLDPRAAASQAPSATS
jgi:glutamine amidotransferase